MTKMKTMMRAIKTFIAITLGTLIHTSTLAQTTTDYDTNDNGLIDITTLAQLNAIRWDLDGNGDVSSGDAANYLLAFPRRNTSATGRMGCPSGNCTGYELMNDLDFDTTGDDVADAPYANWTPIGPSGSSFTAQFNGNNRTISNMTINSSATSVGLFGNVSRGTVTGVGLIDASVTSSVSTNGNIGALVGSGFFATVRSSYATGTVSHTGTGSNNIVGGLVGYFFGGTIAASWSNVNTVSAGGTGSSIGGLVGQIITNIVSPGPGTIAAVYSIGTVSSTGDNAVVGGLIGSISTIGDSVTISASYATGPVFKLGTGDLVSGLIGNISLSTVLYSYWDTAISGIADDSDDNAPEGKTTAELQTPTGYTGIYANWNVNVDGVTGNDNPWAFGTDSQYPVLRYGRTQAQINAQFSLQPQPPVDYDTNNNGLIDITTLAQLNAIRYDLNGDGDVSSGDAANYLLAFPRRDTTATGRMGCQLTDHDDDTGTPDQATCTGYELMNDLDFDENDDGQITAADADYWNSGAGWNPISTFTATFQGNGHTIANLFINRSGTDNIGLFGRISGSARIETLGLTAAEVTGKDNVGILVGDTDANTTIVASFTTGQVSGSNRVGGLVGTSNIDETGFIILACYSTAAVSGRHDSTSIGGLVSQNTQGSAAITASYAIGRVSGNDLSPTRGLISLRNFATITASYWDTETSGIADDTDDNAPEGKTTAELQTPTDYTGIYANWNVNVDGVTGNDNPWAFGENYQYPVLRHGRTPAQIQAQFEALPLRPSSTGADVNEDGRLNEQDALLMVRTYLPGVRGAGVAADDQERATAWQESGRAVGGDLNGDGRITEQDALIMYYAYQFRALLENHAALRQRLLNGLRGSGRRQMPDTDATYRELLRRANRLR